MARRIGEVLGTFARKVSRRRPPRSPVAPSRRRSRLDGAEIEYTRSWMATLIPAKSCGGGFRTRRTHRAERTARSWSSVVGPSPPSTT